MSSRETQKKMLAESNARLTTGIVNKNDQPANESQFYPNCKKFNPTTLPTNNPQPTTKKNGVMYNVPMFKNGNLQKQ